jgi:NAD-dependent SIR2 family protein deacetylase
MNRQADFDELIRAAADAIRTADALLIGAGAGMGVDSGLPDFRGAEGFWKAYPPFRGRRFAEMSTPHWFRTDPPLAWGFFGHRLQLYRSAVPHAGFGLLHKWSAAKPLGAFVFTSNVDGQFQRAGFAESQIVECHGSIHFLQCTRPCSRRIWPADGIQVAVDPATIRAAAPLPLCPDCGAIARPNILMFNDWQWDSARHDEQYARYAAWLRRVQPSRVVAIELGAGLAIPTVRLECEQQSRLLIRINPHESTAPAGHVSLPMTALQALASIDALL